MTKFKKNKKVQKIWQGLYEKHMHISSSDYGKKHVQSSKKISKNCMRSCAAEVPTVYILLRVKND